MASASAAGIAVAGAGAFIGTSNSHTAFAQDATGGAATPVALGDATPPEFGVETNWAVENYDLEATRNVKGSTISLDTIGTLGEAWTFNVPPAGAAFGLLTGQPIVAGDTLYVQDAVANVYTFNKATGEQGWVTSPNQAIPSGGPNGLAAAYGMIFTTEGGTADVVALKADTGEEVWRSNIKGPLNEGITTAPLVYDSVVYVSTIPGSAEAFYGGGQRGLIHALDAATGGVLWYFDTTTDNLWGNPRVNSGGGFWHPPSVDENGEIYIGIGNAAPYPGTPEWPAGTSRPGDNLYADCLLKMDPATGTLVWYYQVKGHDIFDLDNQLTPVLADLEDGRKVAFTSGKHGYVIAVDRESGLAYWKTAVGTHKNQDVSAIPEGGFVEVWPGTLGGVETPLAYADGVVYAAVYELASFYGPSGFDADHPFDFTKATGVVVALNANDGSVIWENKVASGPLAGITIVNDVIFSAGLDGVIHGYSAADGSEVFKYQAVAGINVGPAVSGDWIFWAAGGPLLPSADQVNPTDASAATIIAMTLGASTATPTS
jgi:outer membrane protein assembly factor BamB